MIDDPIIPDCVIMTLVSLWMLTAGYALGLLHAAWFLEMRSREVGGRLPQLNRPGLIQRRNQHENDSL